MTLISKLVLLILLCFNLQGQQDDLVTLDSLVREYKMDQAKEMLSEVDTDRFTKQESITYYYLKGRVERNQLDNAAAMKSFSLGLSLLGPSDISSQAFDFHYYLSVVTRELYYYDLSINYIRKGRIIARKLQNKTFLYESNFLESNAYNVQTKYDSAIHYMKAASKNVSPANHKRLVDIANNIGVMHINNESYQNALEQFEIAERQLEKSGANSIIQLNQIKINKASAYLELGEYRKCKELMPETFEVAQSNNFKEQIIMLLRMKVKYLAIIHEVSEVNELLQVIGNLEHDIIDSTAQDLAIKYNVGLKDTLIKDQKNIIQKTEQMASNRKYGLYFLGALMLLSLLLFYLFTNNKRIQHELQLSQEIIQKQTALQAERTRIAGEMHDDLGGGLTTIKFLGQKMLRKMDNIEQKTQLQKIVRNTQSLVTNMSEIIWAMNAGFDTLDNLIAYCRRYATEYLTDHNLSLAYHRPDSSTDIEFSGEKRRHVFLVFKEQLHNIVKHAEATSVEVAWKVSSDELVLTIVDNGVGMQNDLVSSEEQSGNGLRNMKMRIEKIGGSFSWNSTAGMTTKIELPISSLTLSTTS